MGYENSDMEDKMKLLLLNGSPHERGCTATALDEVARTLREEGVESETFWIGNKPVAGCIACGACHAAGKCAFSDGVNEIVSRLDEFDGMIVGSPVYYAGPSGQLTAFLDRLFYAAGGRMAGKIGAAVVSCRRGGATAAFDRLNKYFTISGMPVVSSQYWNQVHGNTPEEVKRDGEGLQTMRTLARNAAWLLKCIAAGREKGIGYPAPERRISTNFIR